MAEAVLHALLVLYPYSGRISIAISRRRIALLPLDTGDMLSARPSHVLNFSSVIYNQ